MRIISTSASSYVTRNFKRTILLVLFPALLMALFASEASISHFWRQYFDGGMGQEVFWGQFIEAHTIINLGVSWDITFLVLAVLTMCFAWSIIVYTADRHMQLGIVVQDRVVKNSRNIFGRILLFVVGLLLIKEIFNYLIVGIVYFLDMLLPFDTLIIVAICLLIFSKLTFALLLGIFIIALPIVSSEEYPLNVALSYASRLVDKRHSGFSYWFALLYTLVYVAIIVLNCFVNNRILAIVIYFLYYVGIMAYLPIVSCVRFVKDIGATRRDIDNRYIRSRL